MSKKEYLNLLNKYLKNISEEDKQDILAEYETHFISGVEDGQTEENIAKELGHPRDITKEINATLAIDRAESHHKVGNVWQANYICNGTMFIEFLCYFNSFCHYDFGAI